MQHQDLPTSSVTSEKVKTQEAAAPKQPCCHMDEVFLDIALCHYKLGEYINSSLVFIIVKPDELSEFYFSRYQFLELQLKPYF